MGDRQCEGIVEESIIFLDEHLSEQDDIRSCIASLYAFQKKHDTSDTYFHIIERLLKRRYIYVFDMTDHPDFWRYSDVFQAFHGWCPVYRNPTKKGSKQNPEIGFYVNPSEEWSLAYADRNLRPELRGGRLYCVAGSELWAAFVKVGRLAGRDAERPADLSIQKVVAMIAQVAAEKDAPYLVRVWLPTLAFEVAPMGWEALTADPDVQAFRRIAKQMDVLSMLDEDVNIGTFALPVDFWAGYEHEEAVNWFVALDDV
jgi:hypothetical protein